MLETKEQKQVFAGSIILIIILGVVSFWHKPDFVLKPTQIASKPNQSFIDSQAYLNYLKTVPIDKSASQQLLQNILTKDEIKQEVEGAFAVNQAISPPVVDDKKIKVSSKNNNQGVSAYLTASLGQSYSFNNTTLGAAQSLFNGDASVSADLKPKLESLISELYAIEVPKEAVPLHKALVTAYLAYDNLLDVAKTYNSNDYTQNDGVWPEVYKNYAIANQAAQTYSGELAKLSNKYKISYVAVNEYAISDGQKQTGNIFIPEAKAFIGLNFSFTIGDIPRIIMDAVQEGLRSAFLQFMGTMLNKLVVKIEQNYKISNFLYYSDALVNGQYVDDYLNKYVNDPLDQKMIKNFIPQFSCGKQDPNLQAVFQAKSNDYLGFDPSTLDLNDPQYTEKMAKVGSFLSSPSGWQLYYKDLATAAEGQAQSAAQDELLSPGLKSSRNTMENGISGSINSIVSAERASFTAILQLGIDNADSIIGSTVAQLTQTLINQFVFQGVTGNGGNIAVLKEQPTCLDAAILTPVLPLPSSQYVTPGPPPTATAAMAQQCSAYTVLTSDCNTAVFAQLQSCAQNPPQDQAGKQNCTNLASSPFVNSLLAQCQQSHTSDCTLLQSLLQQIH